MGVTIHARKAYHAEPPKFRASTRFWSVAPDAENKSPIGEDYLYFEIGVGDDTIGFYVDSVEDLLPIRDAITTACEEQVGVSSGAV